jgi:hypothetical protein
MTNFIRTEIEIVFLLDTNKNYYCWNTLKQKVKVLRRKDIYFSIEYRIFDGFHKILFSFRAGSGSGSISLLSSISEEEDEWIDIWWFYDQPKLIFVDRNI